MLSVSGASLLTLTSSREFYGHLPLEVVAYPLASLTHKISPGQAGKAAQAPSTHKRTAPTLPVCPLCGHRDLFFQSIWLVQAQSMFRSDYRMDSLAAEC